jgi:hypothetical protein
MAREHFRRAQAFARNDMERQFLERRIHACERVVPAVSAPVSVVARGDSENTQERASHRATATKPSVNRDLLNPR